MYICNYVYRYMCEVMDVTDTGLLYEGKNQWSDGSLVRKRPIGPKKCHWSEKVSLVRKSVIGPKIAGSKGMGFFFASG